MSGPVKISRLRVAGITTVVMATPGKGAGRIIPSGLTGQDWPIVLDVKPDLTKKRLRK